jgi:hypothetical protein
MSGAQVQGRTLERLRVWESAAVARQFAAAAATGFRAWCITVYLTPIVAGAAALGQLVRCGRVSAIVGPRSWLMRHLHLLAACALWLAAVFIASLLNLRPVLDSLLPVLILGTAFWIAVMTAATVAFMTGERKQLQKGISAFARRHGRGRGDAVNLLTYPEDVGDDELRAAAEEIIVSTNPTTMVAVCCLTQREASVFLGLEVGLERDVPGSTILVGPPVPQPDASSPQSSPR